MKSGASIYSTEIYASSIGFYSTKNRKIRNLFRIFLTDATFSDFWRLIFQNHFKDTPREAAAAKPKLLLFFWGVFAADLAIFTPDRYCLKITRNPRRQFSASPMRVISMSRDKYRSTMSLEG